MQRMGGERGACERYVQRACDVAWSVPTGALRPWDTRPTEPLSQANPRNQSAGSAVRPTRPVNASNYILRASVYLHW